MSKPYSQMTPDERLADRIAKNREIDRLVQEAQQEAKNAASAPVEVRGKRKPAGNALDEFQRIKREQGIDAASEFVRNKSK